MDTRTKILSPAAAAEAARACGGPIRVLTGYFDPLLGDHARRLTEVKAGGGTLFVAIQDPAGPLLPARARAELVAALGAVDWVILSDAGPADGWLESFPAETVLREERADARRTEEFVLHVRSRHE